MELNQIRYFLEVAQSQHMTLSAEKLHIAQPALTQSIRRLENDLGVPLFEKKGRNIVLNKYGQYLQKKLLPVIELIDRLPDEMSAMSHNEHNTIYINVLAATSLVTDAIIKYQEHHKDVRFQLLQNTTAESFDIQIATKLFYQQREESTDEGIFTEKIFLAVPNTDKFSGLEGIELKSVEKEGFITLSGSRQFRYICDKFCHYADVKPNYIFESDNPAVVQDMIAANMGIGFWPEFSWGEMKNSDVLLLPITDPDCSRDIIISYNRNSLSGYAEDFYNFLKEVFKNNTF